MAAELMATLSAPALKIFLTSSTVRIPPPTVNGINRLAATLSTISTTVSLLSLEAVISKKTSSSAPSLLYKTACSTGSPASTKLTKLTPFTTLELHISKQGIIRFVYI